MGWLNRALTSTFISGCRNRQREPVVSTARIEDLPASAGPVTHAEGMRSAKNVALDHMPDVSVTEAGWQLPDDFRMAIYIAGFEGELLSRPVDQDLLGCFLASLLAGPFDQFSVDEGCSGADQGDEVGRVHTAPAVLG